MLLVQILIALKILRVDTWNESQSTFYVGIHDDDAALCWGEIPLAFHTNNLSGCLEVLQGMRRLDLAEGFIDAATECPEGGIFIRLDGTKTCLATKEPPQ